MSSEIVKQAPPEQRGAIEVQRQVNQIQYLMNSVLKDGEHYGTIKGCGNKPTLLQSGAEKIAYMFHFVPEYSVERSDLGGGHREYEVRCTLTSRDTGQVMGGGMGTCSTMESKYRYRWDGYGNNRKRVENPDIADCWNTVLKMAKKRAFVDAVKSTTAASDIFTQDIEDLPVSDRPVQATVIQQKPARLDNLRRLFSEAKSLGILLRDKDDPTKGLLGWIRVTYGCEPDELSDAQIAECERHVGGVIADKKSLQAEPETAPVVEYETGFGDVYELDLAENDIEF